MAGETRSARSASPDVGLPPPRRDRPLRTQAHRKPIDALLATTCPPAAPPATNRLLHDDPSRRALAPPHTGSSLPAGGFHPRTCSRTQPRRLQRITCAQYPQFPVMSSTTISAPAGDPWTTSAPTRFRECVRTSPPSASARAHPNSPPSAAHPIEPTRRPESPPFRARAGVLRCAVSAAVVGRVGAAVSRCGVQGRASG